jgi:two-component system OmpR family response regulator
MPQQRILIVEDDTDLRRMFRAALSMAGYAVNEASDGIDALHLIDSHPPDLVILDLHLRVLDGVSVQQELAARAITASIPIVIVTGSEIAVGGPNVACVLRKPVTTDRLLRTVQACITGGAPASGT